MAELEAVLGNACPVGVAVENGVRAGDALRATPRTS
jgi:hypothetical protein